MTLVCPNPAFQRYPATLYGRFAWVIDMLCWGIAIFADRTRATDPRLGVMARYLRRLLARLRAVMARHQAGTLRPPRPRPARLKPPPEPLGADPAPEQPPGPPPRRERPRLPREFAWLLRRIPPPPMMANPLAVARIDLEALLAGPEMAGLIATAPQVGRLLRPLCHALGIDSLPEALRLPSRPSRPPRPPDPARQAARAAARAEAAWARAFRRSLGLPARAPADALKTPAQARPPPKPA